MRDFRHNSCRTWLIHLLAFLWLLPALGSFAVAAENVYVVPIEGEINDGGIDGFERECDFDEFFIRHGRLH